VKSTNLVFDKVEDEAGEKIKKAFIEDAEEYIESGRKFKVLEMDVPDAEKAEQETAINPTGRGLAIFE